ncbi:uncharacterized protein LOC127732764 [Mytilus californianus]|uniref:uncharacterized protein LOC127732764 n=1 Tax=Mytilus californianus TaxID=6549 RepID=UPI002247BE62|nr:uncharacterized protein LOC127732764 [Mytilus californianus]
MGIIAKRHSYGPSTYNARNQLAAIDHNAHCERKVVANKDETERLVYSCRYVSNPLDPRRLSSNIAPVPPPPTQELMAAKISRFNREDLDKTIDYDLDQTIDYEWPTN